MNGTELAFMFLRSEFGGFKFSYKIVDGHKVVVGQAQDRLAALELIGPMHSEQEEFQVHSATLMLALPDDTAVIQNACRLCAVFLELLSPNQPEDKFSWLAKNLPHLKPTAKQPNKNFKERWSGLEFQFSYITELGQLLVKVKDNAVSLQGKAAKALQN